MSQDYTLLITSEHRSQPNFVANVDLTANGIGLITDAIDSLPALFDIDAALQQQLDIDGQWVGFARTVGGVVAVGFFGFADDATALGFGELGNNAIGARFIELGEDTSTTATLADPEYRLLLQAKIIQNDWDGSVAEFEAAAADLIPVPCRFLDIGNAVVSILPSQLLDPVLVQLLTGFDMLPRPAGVRYQLFAPQSPLTWTTAGTVTASGTSLSKTTGTAAWNSAAWIAQPSPANFISWTAAFGLITGGLSANPSGSPNISNLNFGILSNLGTPIQVVESGTVVATGNFGNASAGDVFAVLCDKRNVFYFHNGIAMYISSKVPPASMSPMFCINSVEPGPQVTNLSLQTGN